MLTSPQMQLLHRALLDAFTQEDFDSLLRVRIGARLDLLAPVGSMRSQVFEVLQVAERAGWIHELVRAAMEVRPDNMDLINIANDLGLGTEINVQRHGLPDAIGLASEKEQGPKRHSSGPIAPDATESASWRKQLATMEARVCRVEVGGAIVGTGFLVGPGAVLTCGYVVHEVLMNRMPPASIRCRFDYRVVSGSIAEGMVVRLASSDWLIDYDLKSNAGLDFALLRLERPVGGEPLNTFANDGMLRGWIALPEKLPILRAGNGIMILSCADGGPLVLSMDRKGFIGFDKSRKRLLYTVAASAGSGGAPCFTLDWQLVALHEKQMSSSPSEGFERIGVSAAAVRKQLANKGRALEISELPPETSLDSLKSTDMHPPDPSQILHEDDPQKDRWGGLAERDGRALTIILGEVGRTSFIFNAIVSSTDGSELVGPAIFHLHDSYPKSVIHVRKINSENHAVLWDVSSYGVFTIGVQVKDAHGKWIGLEYNLCNLPNLPHKFLLR